jgi:predicted lactoylglutathione lyase
MLGRFFAFSLAARPIAASYEFYGALGFRSIPVGDAENAPSAAFYDGAIALGIHDAGEPAARLTFVRPNLKQYVRALRRLGVTVEHAELADHRFNHVDFLDPNGQAVRLIEARTFPPGIWDERNVSACGAFLEYSVPTQSIESSRTFWEALGFVALAAGNDPHPWLRLAGRGLVLGLHEARFRPGLTFQAKFVSARYEYFKAKNFSPKAGCPLAPAAHPSATLFAPEGTPLYLLQET